MKGSKKAIEMLVGDFAVKSLDRKERTFEGNLSTSHLDLGDGFARDIVYPGAFKETISFFVNADDPYIPLLDSHDSFSIMNVFGHLLEMEEVLTGDKLTYDLEDGETLEVDEMELRTKWQVIEGSDGDRVMHRLRPGSVRKMSMGYRPQEWDYAMLADGTQLRNLRKVMLREGSLVVFAMNPEAQVDLTTVKGLVGGLLARIESGELEGAELLTLQEIHKRLGTVLTPPEPQASPDQVAKVRGRLDRVLADRLAARIDAVRRSAERAVG